MTALGGIFAVIFLAALTRGRRGLLLALAAAVPFNDSAMLVSGRIAVSPFYFGLVLYVAVTILGRTRRSEQKDGGDHRFLIIFFVYSAAVTLFALVVHNGMPVLAPLLGDESQRGRLVPLTLTSSNFAQLAYLGLNLCLVAFGFRERSLGRHFLTVAFAVGTMAALASVMIGRSRSSALFDNSPRILYARSIARMRGQFSEPSHLGAFALVALLFFAVCLFQSKSGWELLRNTILTAAAGILLLGSAAGTATVGLIIALCVIAVAAGVRLAHSRLIIPAPAMLALLGLCGVLAVLSPRILAGINTMIETKVGGISYNERAFANHMALVVTGKSGLLGAGLGSNRASSLLLLLLSNVGVFGTGMFIAMLWRCIRRSVGVRDRLPALFALAGVLSASFLSLADFSSPVLWCLIASLYMAMPRGAYASSTEESSCRPVRVSGTSGRDQSQWVTGVEPATRR